MVTNPLADNEVSVAVSSSTEEFQSGIANAEDALLSFKGAIGAAGAALAGLSAGALASSVQKFARFEEQMIRIEQVTSEAVANELQSDLQELNEQMPTTQRELTGIAETAGRLGVASDNIREFTRVTAEISTATNIASQDAAEGFARIATLTEEPTSNIRDLGDAVNKLSNDSAASASEIVESLTRASGTLTSLGLSTEEITGLTAALNEVSPSARIAGTQLRRLGQEIQGLGEDDTEDLADALGMTTEQFEAMAENNPNELLIELAETMEEGEEQADELRSAFSTTSRQALTKLGSNLDSLRRAQDMANHQMDEGSSLAEEYRTSTESAAAQTQILRGRLQSIQVAIGQTLEPALDAVIGGLNQLLGRITDLDTRVQGIIGTVAGLGGIIAGAATALNYFTNVSVSASGVAGGLSTALRGLATVLTGPVGVALAAGTTAVAAFQSNFAGFRTAVLSVTSDVRQALAGNLQPVIDELGETIDVIAQRTRTMRSVLLHFVGAVGQTIKPGVLALADVVGDVLGVAFESALDTLELLLNVLQGDFGEAIRNAQDLVRDLFGATTSTIQNVASWLGNKAVSVLSSGIDAVATALTNPFQTFAAGAGTAGSLISFVVSALSGLASKGADWVGTLLSGFPAALNQGLLAGVSIIDAVGSALIGLGRKSVDWVVDKVGGFLSSLGSAVANAVRSGVIEALQSINPLNHMDVNGPAIDTSETDSSSGADGNPVIDIPTGGGSDGPTGGPQTPGGTDISEEERGIFNSVASGGLIAEGGIANVHEGERVVPSAQVTDRGTVEAELDDERLVQAQRQTRLEQRQTREAVRQLADAMDVALDLRDTGGRYDTI